SCRPGSRVLSRAGCSRARGSRGAWWWTAGSCTASSRRSRSDPGRDRLAARAAIETRPRARGGVVSSPAVIVEGEGPVLLATLSRPEKKNAVNCEVMCRLYDAWVELDRDAELRVAILTGRGDTFCAGMDLGEIGKLRSGVSDNEWIGRVRREPHVI